VILLGAIVPWKKKAKNGTGNFFYKKAACPFSNILESASNNSD